MKKSPYTIYVASDSTNFLTSDAIVKMGTTLFADRTHEVIKISNVKTVGQALVIVQTAKKKEPSIVIFSTPQEEVRQAFVHIGEKLGIECLDILSPVVEAFTNALNVPPIYKEGYTRKLNTEYFKKIKAIEFAINNDDGKKLGSLQKADIVLIGVSRTSKTPLSIYLAYQNYMVVNIPLISELKIPNHLFEISSKKVIGLTINPTRLNQIRTERNSSMGVEAETQYSDMNHIIKELEFADDIMKKIGCPIIDVSNKAVEETAEIIMKLIKTNS